MTSYIQHKGYEWNGLAYSLPIKQYRFDFLFSLFRHYPDQELCFYYEAEVIHPFMNGNVRIGRFQFNTMLASGG
jgi:hypothetical protein